MQCKVHFKVSLSVAPLNQFLNPTEDISDKCERYLVPKRLPSVQQRVSSILARLQDADLVSSVKWRVAVEVGFTSHLTAHLLAV
jgi:hypothetical protein